MPPQNVGIKAIEIYVPSRYVAQSDLEKFLGASTGKYTIGLGQTNMSFCDDREDVYSLALTTVSSLLQKYTIDPNTIGRLEVGTESMLDKAKSCKSVLMQLFPTNPDIEGADTYNACYGGTNALFNAVHWIESSSWDGRDAIVVMSDIALYNTPAARPTGGAGCIAMLIGAEAPILLESVRASFMRHAYDFYKPDFKTEYPLVDGHYSSRCYLQALDGCYRRYREKKGAREKSPDRTVLDIPLDEFDYFVFHAPNCKLVSKSYARLMYNDFVADNENPLFREDNVPIAIREQTHEGSLDDKILEKCFIKLSQQRFDQRVQPSLTVPTMCGNMYTAGVYSGLVSLLSNTPSESLMNSRVGVFSFGSGLASTLFSLRVVGDVSPEFYDEMCRVREKAYQQKNYTPTGSIEALASGTYYLSFVDEKFRRTYAVRE
ncbi:Hydroxymethylglutaryl-CoA synthase [Penicillium maclennaniae]|uniref:Hydroxymethylglutaryl-CoA synthase n=1 Tax=Penicillium maclennaniae TaxID=1343394 RepID=UPI002541F090|nr:Hydroxymethylglutaryl-CoA synthase [Penicillium maclennaniae]KAJ5676628.1 Hydroxymethylglutaryl-CoA synthase [Penicillium maclennaniae]